MNSVVGQELSDRSQRKMINAVSSTDGSMRTEELKMSKTPISSEPRRSCVIMPIQISNSRNMDYK